MVIPGGAGRPVGLFPSAVWSRGHQRGLGQSQSPPEDVPGGTEGLRGAWGWAEGCLEVTGTGPSSAGTVVEELGLSSGLGSLCLAYLFIQKGLELGRA